VAGREAGRWRGSGEGAAGRGAAVAGGGRRREVGGRRREVGRPAAAGRGQAGRAAAEGAVAAAIGSKDQHMERPASERPVIPGWWPV
jgi:hypothetical protein